MMTKGIGMGFFGRIPFDREAKKKFQEEWSKMTDSEKLDYMNKRVEAMGQDHFSVEAIDTRCEEWLKKSPEEKQAFIDERKQAFESRMHGMHGHFGHFHP